MSRADIAFWRIKVHRKDLRCSSSDCIVENLVSVRTQLDALFAKGFVYRYARELGSRKVFLTAKELCRAFLPARKRAVERVLSFCTHAFRNGIGAADRALSDGNGFAMGANDATSLIPEPKKNRASIFSGVIPNK